LGAGEPGAAGETFGFPADTLVSHGGRTMARPGRAPAWVDLTNRELPLTGGPNTRLSDSRLGFFPAPPPARGGPPLGRSGARLARAKGQVGFFFPITFPWGR